MRIDVHQENKHTTGVGDELSIFPFRERNNDMADISTRNVKQQTKQYVYRKDECNDLKHFHNYTHDFDI